MPFLEAGDNSPAEVFGARILLSELAPPLLGATATKVAGDALESWLDAKGFDPVAWLAAREELLSRREAASSSPGVVSATVHPGTTVVDADKPPAGDSAQPDPDFVLVTTSREL
jgi:hypothetical protein